MTAPRTAATQKIIGVDGSPLSLEKLPPYRTRWVMRRKADLLAALRGGLITMDEACRRYCLSADEVAGWQAAMDRHGLNGLRAVRRGKLQD